MLDTYHEFANGMCAIIDNQFVVAVNFQVIKSDHEALQYRLGLECDHAVDIPFILRHNHGAIDGFRNVRQEVVLVAFGAEFLDGDCNLTAGLTSIRVFCKCTLSILKLDLNLMGSSTSALDQIRRAAAVFSESPFSGSLGNLGNKLEEEGSNLHFMLLLQ